MNKLWADPVFYFVFQLVELCSRASVRFSHHNGSLGVNHRTDLHVYS
jgi:hypothetical protein